LGAGLSMEGSSSSRRQAAVVVVVVVVIVAVVVVAALAVAACSPHAHRSTVPGYAEIYGRDNDESQNNQGDHHRLKSARNVLVRNLARKWSEYAVWLCRQVQRGGTVRRQTAAHQITQYI
jgi:hypothetical protein